MFKSAAVLQDESKVCVSAADLSELERDILSGKWESVLERLWTTELPFDLSCDLYEQIYLEILEKGDRSLCTEMLNTLPVFHQMRTGDPLSNVRYRRLQSLLDSDDVAAELYHGSKKQDRRIKLVRRFSETLAQSSPARLLRLLQESAMNEIKQIYRTGGNHSLSLDLLTGFTAVKSTIDRSLEITPRSIRLPGGAIAESVAISADGRLLIIGQSDGLIEIYSAESMTIATELEYQIKGEFMIHSASVTSIAMDTNEGSLLVAGDKQGEMGIWDTATGVKLRALSPSHTDVIASLEFSKDCRSVLSASVDKRLRLYGVKSGRMLKEFQLDDGSLVAARFVNDDMIVAACTDATILLISRDTFQLVSCINAADAEPGASCSGLSTNGLVIARNLHDQWVSDILVSFKSPMCIAMNLSGASTGAYKTLLNDDFCGVQVSPSGSLVYIGSMKGLVHVFDRLSHQEVQTARAGDAPITCMYHHPSKELLLVASLDGSVYLFSK